MYKVYADDILIHDSRSPSNEIHLADPKLILEDSAAGSFAFTMTPANQGYNDVRRFTTTIIIYRDSTIIWTGRVILQTDDFWHCRKFTCEGALAFLNDSQQPLNYYNNMNSDTFFRRLITNHNTRVPDNRKFQVGTITMHDRYDPYKYKTDYKSTFETIKSTLFDVLGGHLRVRYNGSNPTPIIDYLDAYPNTSSQEINFGENLLEFTKNWDLSKLCTVIIPRGKQLDEENIEGDKEYLTVESVNNGSIYLQNDTAVETYGQVEKVVDFNQVEDPSTLKSLGQTYLEVSQFDDMILNISAVDLHMLSSAVVSFNLLDEVRCISAPHGLNRTFPITKIDIPLDKPDGVKYTMGSKENTSMTSQSISSSKTFESNLKQGLTDLLADAKKNAAEIINSATTGYINIITENEKSQALIISDTPDVENATNLWRFNLNGLGYSSNGGSSYKLAMTMDGVIVADFIRTGVIDDGYGYNRWNLTTGEFQLAYNTKFFNDSEEYITFVDVVSLADSNATKVDKSLKRQYGSYNLLNGTNTRMILATKNGEWSKGEWDGYLLGAAATKKIIDISGLPNSSIVKALHIEPLVNNYNNPSYFAQRNVKVAPYQTYVASCYAKASGSSNLNNTPSTITISIGKSVDANNSQVGYASATGQIQLDDKWRRYTFTFVTAGNDWTNDDVTQKHAAIDSGKTDVMFGFSSEARNICLIAGMTLERGNTATDWSESNWDTSDFSTYTANQEVGKLDATLNNMEIFKRITSGNAAQGLYMSNGTLLINASYIKTGILDAKVLRTGIITDATGKTKWDLTKSILSTTNISITGGSISFGGVTMNSGGFTAGTGNVIKLGASTTASSLGLLIGSSTAIELVAPYIRAVPKAFKRNGHNSYYSGSIKTGITKDITIETVQWVRASGSTITWQPQKIDFQITSGLITGITVRGSSVKNYGSNDDFEEEAGIEE